MLGTSLFIAVALLTSPAAAKPVDLAYWSVRAIEEDGAAKQYGPGLDDLKPILADLPHERFELLGKGNVSAAFGSEASVRLAPEYKLKIEPHEEETQGRIRIRVVVEYEKHSGQSAVNAIDTRVVLTPGKKVRLGGMKLEKGDLVLVLSAR